MSTGRGEVAFAHAQELDEWRRRLELTPAGRAALTPPSTEAGTSNESNGNGEEGVVAVAPRGDIPPPAVASRTPAERAGRRWLIPTAALLLVVAAASAGFWLWPIPQPSAFSVADGTLRVFDRNGRFLWSHPFSNPLQSRAYEGLKAAGLESGRVEDIDGDGDNEVILMTDPGYPSSEGLFVFNHDGSVRFSHRSTRTVRYAEVYASPWPPQRFFLARQPGGGSHIWLVSSHFQEFPSVLEKLDAQGRNLGEYWSNGHISSLAFTASPGRAVVLVGAANNESGGGSLAVLDAAKPSGSAPAVNPKFSCRDCPAGSPIEFMVFPSTEIPRSHGGLASVNQINVEGNGQIRVEVWQDAATFSEAGGNGPHTYYLLDSRFRIVSAYLGQTYKAAYQHLQQTGLLNAPLDLDSPRLFPAFRWQDSLFAQITGPEAPE